MSKEIDMDAVWKSIENMELNTFDDVFKAYDFKIRQIIVGDVQLDAKPSNVPADLRQLDFVGAKCSVTLVQHYKSGLKMLVDCGSPYEREQLLQALREHGIPDPDQITHLVITHWHIDHCGQIQLFPRARLITPEAVLRKDHFGLPKAISMLTFSGGHSNADLTVQIQQRLKKPLSAGQPGRTNTTIIAGDLFEHNEDWTGLEPWKASSMAPKKQAEFREFCWKCCEMIVPGHGRVFWAKGDEVPKSEGFGTSVDCSARTEGLLYSDPEIIRKAASNSKASARFEELYSFPRSGHIYRIHLIRTPTANILVNTGAHAQRESVDKAMIQALHQKGLSPAEITHVVITHQGEHFCANMGLFERASVFTWDGIAITTQEGPFYAAFEHDFLPLENGLISIWRDQTKDNADQCSLSVLIVDHHMDKQFCLIGHTINGTLLTKLDLKREQIRWVKPVESV